MQDSTVTSGEHITKRSVLIVEDNEINREMLKEILADDYNVIEAVDGVDGIEKMTEHRRILSLVLLDIQMPRMDGYGFLRCVSEDSRLSMIPIIVTTGSTISEDEENCLALGASDFVNKPYNPKIILRRIEALIRLRESIATLREVEFDQISGLYNKAAFYHHARGMLDIGADESFSMLLLNVEDFSLLNERYGENRGNELLKYMGDSIRSAADGVLSCRYSADRFILIANDRMTDICGLIPALEEKLHADPPIRDFTVKYAFYAGVEHDLPVSVLCDRLGSAVNTIRHQFNQQMVQYDIRMSEKAMRMHMIEDCMEQALAEGQFQVWYQPKHDPQTGKISGAEALARWIHPQYGFMSPGDFIPLFENNGFISNLDLYIWTQVCRDLKRWKEQGLPLIPISVNASRRDFIRDDYLRAVEGPQIENGVDKKYLHLEITESHCTDDKLILDRVREIHERGFSIELDDFGSGYSSLGTIKEIPMDIIKLDISFSRDIEKKREIVQMIIALAHSIGLKVVAEGVESTLQHDTLRAMKCDYIQGYYYSKPLPAAQFEKYVRANLGLE